MNAGSRSFKLASNNGSRAKKTKGSIQATQSASFAGLLGITRFPVAFSRLLSRTSPRLYLFQDGPLLWLARRLGLARLSLPARINLLFLPASKSRPTKLHGNLRRPVIESLWRFGALSQDRHHHHGAIRASWRSPPASSAALFSNLTRTRPQPAPAR